MASRWALLVSSLLIASRAAWGQCPGLCRQNAQASHCHWLEVESVVPNSPADRAGIMPGDALFSYDGRTVGCMGDLAATKAAATRDSVTIVFLRGRQQLPLRIARTDQLGVHLREWLKDVPLAPDAKIVANVPRLSWSSGKTNSFIAALEAALIPLGDTTGYTLLSGLSGAAFRTQFFDSWCPSSADPTCGYNTAAAALISRGIPERRMELATDGKNRSQLLAAIKASIEAGIPVLAWSLTAEPEWGVITGYQQDGAQLLCRTYSDTRKGYDIARQFPRIIYILSRPSPTPIDSLLIRQSFRISLDNLLAERYGEYWTGLAALTRWQQRLRTDNLVALDSSRFANVVRTNSWLLNQLVSDRRAGIDFLRTVGQRWLPALSSRLEQLSRIYAEEVDLLGPLAAAVPQPGEITSPSQWSAELRERQTRALNRARQLEEETVPLWRELGGAK